MQILAIFGPTAVGKTQVAVAVAEILRARGEDPVAISADALQLYRGMEVLTGAPSPEERERLEHRLIGIAEVSEEFSAGRYAALAQVEVDDLLGQGRRPMLVGGTGLYLRVAVSDVDLRPPVDPRIREKVENEMLVHGSRALHRQLEAETADRIHPNDRKRVARALELQRAGIKPARSSERLWDESYRRPTLVFGLSMNRRVLEERIEARVAEMATAGAADEARRAKRLGASRTARQALGFSDFMRDDLEGVKRTHMAYAKRQLTWMRKMANVEVIDCTGRDRREIATEIVDALDN